MEINTLWSLRLGFSGKQSQYISDLGMKTFLEKSFNTKFDSALPAFLENAPKTLKDYKLMKKEIKENPDFKKEMLKKEVKNIFKLKSWWIDKMIAEEFPLQEKMTCFWHNHFVSTAQKVKVTYWIYQHNQILRENAFGNFKTLTKQIVKTNAMVRFLDNTDNRKGKLNENLSRELLELFTLGIGNYTEDDIKNGAKGLAGLGVGPENAMYRTIFEDSESFQYLGQNGNFKIDEMIDIIFNQSKIPYLITRKILQWFIYDNPKEELVVYYGDYFKKENFEIKPLLTKIFTEEFEKNTAGSKIKNPIEFILPLINDLNVQNPNGNLIAYFLKQQGMDLFNQPNVKGWTGGKNWLTSQIYLQRNTTADLLCNGKNIKANRKITENDEMEDENNQALNPKLNWNKKGNNKQIISEIAQKSLYKIDDDLQQNFEKILKYDFEPQTEGSENAVMRLFNYMVKTPEYQLI